MSQEIMIIAAVGVLLTATFIAVYKLGYVRGKCDAYEEIYCSEK